MKNSSFYNTASALCYIILIGIILSSSPALAKKRLRPQLSERQQNQISGIITDGRAPLPGVTIAIKNQINYVVLSDFDGKYSLLAKANDTLVVSYIGYKTAIIPINYRKNIHIQLQEDITSLQEVRINAGYYSVKEKERTGSIARITSKDIETQPVTNVLATMQGRMAGVDIVQDSGSPGGSFSIKIRGQNSLRADGNQPLYIIDGVPYSSETIGSTATSGTAPTMTSPLNSINPSDVESIEVLKDADATAIYGSRGANGVVLITTKKGKAGVTQFSVNSSSSFGTVTDTPKLMNTQQYLAMRKQAFANDGVTVYPSSAYDINGTWSPNRYTDWQDKLIGGTARIYNLQASVSGGSLRTQYLLSGNYRTETTVFPGDFKYSKGSAHFNMNHMSDDERFKMTFSGNYTSQNNNQPSVDLTPVSRILPPNAPELYDANGNLNWENGTWTNPLAGLESEFESRINDLVANVVLSYRFVPNLEFKSSFGFTDLDNNENRTQPFTMYDPSFGLDSKTSSITTNLTTRSSWIVEPQLNYTAGIGKGHFEVLLGSTLQNQRTERLYQFGSGFASNSLIHDLASATIKNIRLNDATVYKYAALFARLNYNWDTRYMLNLTGRRDGSSRFGPGKQFATFGAVGAAWLFSNEAFLKDSKVLSFGKLRASYGSTGNDQIGDYQFLDTYVSTGNNYQGIVGLQPARLFNPEFGWESNQKFEMALETGFFKDRIFLTTAYYSNRSSNQLVGMPLPGSTGFSTLYGNLDATVQNSGFELTLRTINLTQQLKWSTNFNISLNRNKLLSYPGLESSTYANTYVVGEPTSIMKVYHYTGMNLTTAVYEFEDMNRDGLITSLGDKQTLVNLTPSYFGGLENQLRYKGAQLDFLFQFVKQQAFAPQPGVPGVMQNQPESVNNPNAQQPYTAGKNGNVVTAYFRYATSDGAVEDASYIRLKNISLTYDLPLKFSKGLRCQLYWQGQNLLTFTNYSYGDPEFKMSNNYLPPLKVNAIGVKLSF
ncbi:SusC/RagA family TonB-linked outer membrane protein [Flavobacterium granuli]|uniref:TonB-linked SusC/RagA family outer membrane protein n=1 Tax=Flavobacterium granuli TaxID=280093 RepID=A0A1M5U699_9FLAO|nr:SusC/RagA family TonB-linked outer membrane protein [Flavobacterium granuli]PRZ19567.1 TonB-linked SusC/RagA family outer membrane protein [Flavobacterium granuli]SHH58430.1 TonB-linked outer membrane protein, SusC/RagA family [Flavobacterium granuli]